MVEDLKVKYELPILDIFAVCIAFLAFFLALISLFLSNETRWNTSDTTEEIQLSRGELVKIRFLLEDIHDKLNASKDKDSDSKINYTNDKS